MEWLLRDAIVTRLSQVMEGNIVKDRTKIASLAIQIPAQVSFRISSNVYVLLQFIYTLMASIRSCIVAIM